MPFIPTMIKSNSKTKYTFSVGRRKSAVATVKLFSGKGSSSVNGVDLEKYFPSPEHKIRYQKPFVITENIDKFNFQAKIVGGGKMGQLDALTLAISRALTKLDINYKPALRADGLMTVDSRVRERRMVGTGGKARRQKQSPKR